MMRALLSVVVALCCFASNARAQDAAPPAPEEPAIRVRAKMGEGVTIESGDGRFALQIRGRIQLRGTTTVEDDEPRIGFMVRRLRLTLSGHVFSPDWKYNVQFGFAPLDMEADLLIPVRDAYITYAGVRDMNVRFGQMKVPFSRERVTSSSSLQFADRSLTNAELSLDRDMGIQIFSQDLFGLGGYLGYNIGVFGGDGRNRVGHDAGLLYAARFEVFPFGKMDDAYKQADFVRSMRPRMAIAGGFGFNHRTRRLRSTLGDTLEAGSFDYVHWEADMIFKVAGFSFEADVLSRRATRSAATGTVDGMEVSTAPRNALGWFAQAGYLFIPEIEATVRYTEVHPLADSDPSLILRREIGGALSWYLSHHDLKLQLDYTHQFGPALGDGIHEVRLQTQLAY